MPAQFKRVNLLPPTEFEQSFWGKFLKWSITSGRYIIIVTELIVILAFLSRFKLDADIADLNSEISGKKNVLDAQIPFETNFLTIQSRLQAAETLMKSKLNGGEKIDLVIQDVPVEVKLTKMQVTRAGTLVEAATLNEKAMGIMMSRMSINPNWEGVEVKKISSDPLKGIEFELLLKKGK